MSLLVLFVIIFRYFNINLGYLPDKWQIAQNIMIPKPGKDDPSSTLSTY